ncbi:chemotaxis response regulator protein-glutamate methylesterase [Virgisporangium aliadipatigenens]|uniref:Protein-glutamate methylesterase/protein-glutamine glutaminase n=1 Tax=Virgisporangium aliadipatigenens TaxID=741659 RepID=A0A8J3YH13_9ACTN|nr:chemotaxis response regulator protein-glutamate methylesterase [Virgisporangium aliadipatigenens]
MLVVEDSPTVRHRITEILGDDPELDVIATAADGRSAIELTMRTRPDVITMDIMLPLVSGQAATEYIMAHCPTPILVVSSADNRTETFTTCDALAAGAVEVLEKPHGGSEDDWERQLLSAVKLVSRIPVITHPRGKLGGVPRPAASPAVSAPRSCELVAIGASTGGPGAVVDLLRALPREFPLPLLLVQHISAPFAGAFVEWLGAQVGRKAVCAQDGDRLVGGQITVAPADVHMTVRHGRLRLDSGPPLHSCRPSVDVLFDSVAADVGPASAACLLTGMGRDGAAGLLAIRRAGGFTAAQDEATSVVYGMPREAALLDAADEISSPERIGRRLADLVKDSG